MMQILYAPEINPILLELLDNKSLLNFAGCSKAINQIITFYIQKVIQQGLHNFYDDLLLLNQFKRKEITQIPKRIDKNINVKIKDFGREIVKISLYDIKKQFFGLQWDQVPIKSVIEDQKFTDHIAFKCGKLNLFMNRSLIDPSLDFEFEEEEDNSEKQTLQDIADSNQFRGDFNNMQEILSRQRAILNKIDQQKVKKQKQINNQQPNPKNLLKIEKYAMILCHGGFFAIAIYQSDKCIYHKSDHKYVVRAKQGQRQLTKDSNAGSNIKSMGSQIRRDQEKKHQQKVNSILTDAYPILETCEIIFLQAPGVNKQILIQDEEPLFKLRDKIRSLCVTAKKVNYTEIDRLNKSITTIYLAKEEEMLYF